MKRSRQPIDGKAIHPSGVSDTKYSQCKKKEKGRKVICIKLHKALHGSMQVTLLFWKRITESLVNEIGLRMNQHGSYVASQSMSRTLLVTWCPVDHFKHTHRSARVTAGRTNRNARVTTSRTEQPRETFGRESTLVIKRGRNARLYFGMRINFSEKGKRKCYMRDQDEHLIIQIPSC